MLKFYVLTPETAEEFYETAIMKEAVTEKERVEILENMEKDGDILTSGVTPDSKEDFVKKLSEYARVFTISKKDKK